MKYSVVGLASDHAGYELKQLICTWLRNRNIPFTDFGTNSTENVDYPVFGHKLAKSIEKKEVSVGIGMCGSGNGINMTLNKHQFLRSALCWNEEIVRLARTHNDANVLVLPARFLSYETAKKMIKIFLKTPFEGGERHQRRISFIPIIPVVKK